MNDRRSHKTLAWRPMTQLNLIEDNVTIAIIDVFVVLYCQSID